MRPSTAANLPSGTARLATVILACVLAAPSFATTYRFMTARDVIAAADLVFLGTVTDVVAEVRDGTPWTLVSLRLDDLYRGFGYDPASFVPSTPLDEAPPWQDPAFAVPEVVTLAFLGGESAGGDTLLVSGAPSWRFEGTYLVAAYQRDGLASPIVGFRQGVWQLVDGSFSDLDGWYLAVGADGLPERGQQGASRSQATRAVQAVLAGAAVEGASDGGLDALPTAPDAPAVDQAEPAAPADADGGGDGPTAPAVPADRGPTGEDTGSADAAALTPSPIVAEYDVDDSGGPLLLSEQVARAAQAWRTATVGAVELELVQRAGSRAVLRYGPEALLGPDTLSLTTVAGDGTFTALLSPTAGDLLGTALLHELGLILGAAAGGDGVMAFAVTGAATGPSGGDVEQLRVASLYQPADLTHDGRVDFYDLVALAEAYGNAGVNVAGDLDGDGVVDDADVEALRTAYQFGTPPQGTGPTAPGSSATDTQ